LGLLINLYETFKRENIIIHASLITVEENF